MVLFIVVYREGCIFATKKSPTQPKPPAFSSAFPATILRLRSKLTIGSFGCGMRMWVCLLELGVNKHLVQFNLYEFQGVHTYTLYNIGGNAPPTCLFLSNNKIGHPNVEWILLILVWWRDDHQELVEEGEKEAAVIFPITETVTGESCGDWYGF